MVNQLSEVENITIASLKMSTSVHCWWENLSTNMEKEEDPIDTWVKFVKYVWKEFYPPKYLEQQYKKWQQLSQWKDQAVHSYNDDFYRLMARLGIQEEEKFLVLKYVSGLSLYIQQEMEFLTVSTLADVFHYANELEAKQKGKIRFVNNPTGRTFNKKSPTEFDKFKNPS